MRLLIDGVDGTGKSTLANFLAEKTGMKVIKFSAPKTTNVFEEWKEYYEEGNEKYIGDNVILDRCWISELIYGPIKKRTKLTKEQIDFFKEKTKDDIYIISYTSIKNIEKSFNERGEDFINLEEAKIINDKFFKFGYSNILGKIMFFYDMEQYADNLENFYNLIFSKNA